MQSPASEERHLVLTPFFTSGPNGRVFCVFVGPPPSLPKRAGVLFVPGFAEEMNKSRRQVMLQARSLAAEGFGVLIVDLFGTGDSEGEFLQARWSVWLGDLLAGARWLESQGFAQLVVWAARWGALLAVELLDRLGARAKSLVLWQPVLDGRQYMDQFLRTRVASSLLAGGARVTVQDLRNKLDAGEVVEVAGYALTRELVREIDARRLAGSMPAAGSQVDWFEIVTDEGAGVGLGAQRTIEKWNDAGVVVHGGTVVGPQFWSSVEITVAPALVDATTRRLSSRA